MAALPDAVALMGMRLDGATPALKMGHPIETLEEPILAAATAPQPVVVERLPLECGRFSL